MIKDRISRLRQAMKERGVDIYMVPTDDFHNSEYVGEYFKCRKYITGFTGSAGVAVITMSEARLWTDGRYFIQAESELQGTDIILMKMGEKDVPTIRDYLKSTMSKGQVLGFDGRCVNARYAEYLEESLNENEAKIDCDMDLVGNIWDDRPAISREPVELFDVKYCGRERSDKLKEIRTSMKEKSVDKFVLTSLDDIAWLFNIRGNDVLCNPVVLAYAIIDMDKAIIYGNESAFSEEVRKELAKDNISVELYNNIYGALTKIKKGNTVLIDKDKTNYAILKKIPEGVDIVDEDNLTQLPKAIKNSVEVNNERMAHVWDGVAVTRFIYWLKKNIGKLYITELSAAAYLENLRKENEHYIGPSFEPIVAYGANGAMCHYSPTEESNATLMPEGFVLFDTGGQYYEGTTDITRTIALGPCSGMQKRHFTAVLKGHLNMAAAKFMYGVRGLNLDCLARGPLWEMGLDYNHGTGHGVGYYLNVHEGPNHFGWRCNPNKVTSAVLEEGMITSNEPGFYLEGEYGIRTENMIVCVKAEENEYGQFMRFENLTMVPIDLEAIDFDSMGQIDIDRLNAYHKKVFETISPYLSEDEAVWLKEATKEV